MIVLENLLEYQYEDVLRGKKKEMKYTTDKSGKVTSSEVSNPGARGRRFEINNDIIFKKK